ncbi:hypothetical protein [Absidia glauca]|uniref:Transposase Tc1-like domain-containing protein n=1 Tax=Absidia glauca TaxID=4829 RepID=A0A163L0Q8_ABSGL|nr:hypothetical protein [Absidia glauca]
MKYPFFQSQTPTMSVYTCCQKAYIRGCRRGGMSVSEIAKGMDGSESGIYRILRAQNEDSSSESAKPKAAVVLAAKRNRRTTLGELTNSSGLNVGQAVIRRTLHEAGMNCRICGITEPNRRIMHYSNTAN